MALGSCIKCFKYSVFLFNFLLWLLGCTLLAVGGWLLTEDDAGRYVEKVTTTSTDHHVPLTISYSQVTDRDLARPVSYLFLVAGAILVLTVAVGCCGAVRDNLCLLKTFLVLLFVVFVVLLGMGLWSFTASKDVDMHTTRLEHLTNDTLKQAVRHYYTDQESRALMDAVQTKFECCGADNAVDDYRGQGPNPSSCQFAHQRQSCLPVYFDYVANHFEQFVQDRLILVASLSVAFAICLVVHMLCVVMLCCAAKERNRGRIV